MFSQYLVKVLTVKACTWHLKFIHNYRSKLGCTSYLWGCLTTTWLMRGLIGFSEICKMHISLFFNVNYQCMVRSLKEVGNVRFCYCFSGLVPFALLLDQLTLMKLGILVLKYANFPSLPSLFIETAWTNCYIPGSKSSDHPSFLRSDWRIKIICFLTEIQGYDVWDTKMREIWTDANLKSGCCVVGPRCYFQANLVSSCFSLPVHHDWCL